MDQLIAEQENVSSRHNTTSRQLNKLRKGSSSLTGRGSEGRFSAFSKIDENKQTDFESFRPANMVNLDSPLNEDPNDVLFDRPRRQTIATNSSLPLRSDRKRSMNKRASLDGRHNISMERQSRGFGTRNLYGSSVDSMSRSMSAKRSNTGSKRLNAGTVKKTTKESLQTPIPTPRSRTANTSHRVNKLDLKCKEAETKAKKLEAELIKVREESSTVKQHNIAMKRELNELRMYRRKYTELEREFEAMKRTFTARIRSLEDDLHAHKDQHTKSTEKAFKHGDKAVSAGQSSAAEETFSSAHDVLPVHSTRHEMGRNSAGEVRRNTMAPGEISRIRDSKASSRFIKVQGLKRGSNSSWLFQELKEYGVVISTRIAKDIFTEELIGYAAFSKASSARIAVDGMKRKGYKAIIRASSPRNAHEM